jgi:hypothetical protein
MSDTQPSGPTKLHLPVDSLTTRFLGLAAYLYWRGHPVKAVATPGKHWVTFVFSTTAEADAKEFSSPSTLVPPAAFYQAVEDMRMMLQQARAAAGRAS